MFLHERHLSGFSSSIVVIIGVSFLSLFCISIDATAQTPSACVDWADAPSGTNSSAVVSRLGKNNYRVNVASFDNLNNVSRLEGKRAVVRSAEQWSSHGSAGWFAYEGTATETNLLWSDDTCNTTDYNLVVVNPNCDARGNVSIRCSNTRWVLTICAKGSLAEQWEVGDVTSSSTDFNLDLNATLTHEFGHALGLWHPGDTGDSCTSDSDCDSDNCVSGACTDTTDGTAQAASTMQTSNTASNGGGRYDVMRQRHLYPDDIECLEEINGNRSEDVWAAVFTSTGSRYNIYTSKTGMVRGAGVTHVDSNVDPQYTSIAYDGAHRMGQGYYYFTTSTTWNNSYSVGVGPSTSWWLDSTDRLRYFYGTNVKSNRFGDWAAKFDMFQYNYDLGLTPGNVDYGYMRYCTANPTSCNSLSVRSNFKFDSAHDSYSDEQVFAWAQQDRSSNPGSTDHQILISVGTRAGNDFLLNKPEETGIRTATGVQVACGGAYQADGYDCIIVYTRVEDPMFNVYARPFWVRKDATDESTLFWGSETTLPFDSIAETAVWYSYDKFWVAYKFLSNTVYLRSSTDSLTWTYEGPVRTSINAPSVAYTNVPAHGVDSAIIYGTD